MKKLLAVILSAAMVLGMSATAFAADTTTKPANIVIEKGGDLVVNVKVTNDEWNVLDETHFTYDASKGKATFRQDPTFAGKMAEQGYMGGFTFNGNVAGDIVLASAFVDGESGAPVKYTGLVATITFTQDQLPVTVTCNGQEVKLGEEAVETTAPSQSPEPSKSPEPSDPTESQSPSQSPNPSEPSETQKPSQSPNPSEPSETQKPSQSPNPSGGSGSGAGGNGAGSGAGGNNAGTGAGGNGAGSGAAGTGSTGTGTGSTGKGTGSTGTGSGSASAAKTADVAPVATLAILALAAGVVVINMKKKVTE